MCQLGAAITVAVQTKHAVLLTRVLGTEESLITIGVSTTLFRGYFFRIAPKYLPSLSHVIDMGNEWAGVRRDDRRDYDILRTCRHPVPNSCALIRRSFTS